MFHERFLNFFFTSLSLPGCTPSELYLSRIACMLFNRKKAQQASKLASHCRFVELNLKSML
jgi:hypothetical protein